MKRIRCYNYAGDYVNSLVQWDRNQVVYVDDLENGAVPGVHYASTGYKDVSWEFTDVASLADDGRVKIKIPDIMMQYDGKLYLFLFYGENETIATTKYVVELTVKEKPKPDDWVWADETWYKTMQQIQIDVNKVLSITESKVNNPSEGKVGQILEIASVDMNGKPLTYIAVDKPRSITDDDIISPIATVTQTDTGATISIQDKNGTTTANIIHGRDGKDGENGQDGYTPVKGVDYFDGEKGDKGDKGDDGYTPQKGVDYFDGQDGKDGEKGADGTSVTVSNVSESIADGGSNVVTFSDGKTLTIKNGSKGKDGEKGEDGKDYVLTDADKQEIVQTIEDNVSVNIPTKTSQLENDSDYVTKDVTDNLSEQLANKEASGTAQSKVTEHNIAKDSHNDIRLLITNLSNLVSNLLDSDDETLNQTSEIVAYIKSNKTLIDAITTSKVSISDIVDNLTTNVSNKPLSAKQGLVLKGLIDAIVIPTLLSQLGEDANHRTVTDAEKATWNAKSNFSGAYADLSGKPTIPSKTSQLTNDSGFLTQHQSLSGYAKTADHYTKTESDNKYQSKGNYLTAVPSEYVTETELNAKGYLTAVPSEYVTETELTAKKYLTSIPSEYVTETELTAKKYATQTDVNKFGGTIEVTSGNPTKENTVLTINPNADEVNVYTSDEVDAIASRLEGQIADYNMVTPQMYGAVGDGVNDDTEYFERALAENDNVYVPTGNYVITRPLDLTYKKSLVSDDGQNPTIIYAGDESKSVVLIGRLAIFRNINVRIKTAPYKGIVFDTNNLNLKSSTSGKHSRVEHVKVSFNSECQEATLIGITVDSGTDANNMPICTGGCYQEYNDIVVDGGTYYGTGIKMTLIQGRAFTEESKLGFPWLTHISYNDIYLGCPYTAIKAGVENTSGSAYFKRINMGHILFNNVTSQSIDSSSTRYFLDVNHISAYLSKCIGWDYHHTTDETGNILKANIIGEDTNLSFTDGDYAFGSSLLQSCDFIAEKESEFTIEESPAYFIDKYFKGTFLREGYDSVDAKINAKMTDAHIGDVAEDKVNEILYSGYNNLMENPLTQLKKDYRFSNSSQTWVYEQWMLTVVIPIVKGGNIIRWLSNICNLNSGYRGMFFFNDDELTTGKFIAEYEDGILVSNDTDVYLDVPNPNGYKYVSIPFRYTEDVSSENTIITINSKIVGDGSSQYVDYVKQNIVNPVVDTKIAALSIPKKTSQLTNDSGFLTREDIGGTVDGTKTLTMVGVDASGNSHTWIIYGEVVS